MTQKTKFLKTSHYPAQTNSSLVELTIGELLEHAAISHPDSIALHEVDLAGKLARQWTYKELYESAIRLSHWLINQFEPGTKVAIWAPNCPEWVILEYASAFAGLVLVTANPAFQARELRYTLEQSKSSALFLIEEYRGNPMASIAKEAIKGNNNILNTFRLLDIESFEAPEQSIRQLPTVDPGMAAQIQYTSGTTGFPKGAVLSHRGLVNNAKFYAERSGVNSDSVWINMMPLFHTTGCSMITLGCAQSAAKMILVSLFDADRVNQLIESESVTIVMAVPTMVIGLADSMQANPIKADSLKLVSCGGAAVAPELVRRIKGLYNCKFSTVYGQTEYSPVVTQHLLEDSIDDICGSAGLPLPHTSVSIRTLEDNRLVPIDSVGEICVKGVCTMLGYNDDRSATEKAIDANGWLHTGDLGKMDSRGYVSITGRVKEMIIRGGENYFPVEIENVLLEHPCVSEVAVVGLQDDKWGEIIACFIKNSGRSELDISELRKHCRQNLSPQKTPAVWFQLTEFPLTGSGKVQKFKLREMVINGDISPL